MKCLHCNKEILDPLILLSGKLACPNCKQEIASNNVEFKITEENKKILDLGIMHYYKALSLGALPDAKSKNNYLKNIESALMYFSQAAELSNPYAYYYLGYLYDFGFVGVKWSEDARFRMAHFYYKALYDNPSMVKEEDLSSIKVKAARNDLVLLKRAFDMDTYESEKQRIVKKYISLGIDDQKDPVIFNQVNPLEKIAQAFLSSSHIPVIYGIRVSYQDVQAFIEEMKKALNTKKGIGDTRNARIRNFFRKNDIYFYNTEREFVQFSSAPRQLEEELEEIFVDDEGFAHILAFNLKVDRLGFLNKKSCKEVEKIVLNDYFNAFLDKVELIVSADDFYYNKKGHFVSLSKILANIFQDISNLED